MKKERGFTLVELMVAVVIGGFLSLVLAGFFTFSVEQFYSLIDQNETEQSVLMASYYLRASLSQAVKTMNADPINFTGAADNTTAPVNIPVGYFNGARQCADAACNTMAPGSAWTNGWPAGAPVNTLAIFPREAGTVSSNYILTGIFYIPPDAANPATSGRIYVAQIPSGGMALTDANLVSQFYFDHIVAFGVAFDPASITSGQALSTLPAPNVPLSAVSLYIRARYFRATGTARDYSPNAAATAAGALFFDINTVVNVSLRNNIIGNNTTATGGYERPANGLYFYQFTTPALQNF